MGRDASASARTLPPALEALARRAAILTEHTDGLGRHAQPSARVVRSLAEMVLDSDAGPPTLVVDAGARRAAIHPADAAALPERARLELEDGGLLTLRFLKGRDGASAAVASGPIPVGVHALSWGSGRGARRRWVMARPRTLAPLVNRAGRRLAVFLPLHALGEGAPLGVGTYAHLSDLAAWARRHAGPGALVGTLPLFPSFLDKPFDPSPYAPVSRLAWNELFIEPAAAPEWREASVRSFVESAVGRRLVTRAGAGAWLAGSDGGTLVDYRTSWRTARRVLGAMASAARAKPRRWTEVLAAATPESARYALFRAAVEATGKTWPRWPARWRRGDIRTDDVGREAIDTYIYAQSLAESQVAAMAGRRRPLYLDLPVGVHAEGFDTWSNPDLYMLGVSAGAPPDDLNPHGQVWGFPPMHPLAGRRDGYAHLRAVLRRLFAVAGVLRIDHVMGLYRMYGVPSGRAGEEGAYVRFPEREFFAAVLIEAARAGAIVVGEDLGTVPPEVRQLMTEHGLLGMHVQQFALGAPERPIAPAAAGTLACLNTHDMPPFAAFWTGADIGTRVRLGILPRSAAASERAGRARMRRAVARELRRRRLDAGNPVAAALSIMRLHAHSPAPISLVNLEDLWGETRAHNVPGTVAEHPNWRRRSARGRSSIIADARIGAALARLSRERRRGGGASRR